jgi:hypothetical protein
MSDITTAMIRAHLWHYLNCEVAAVAGLTLAPAPASHRRPGASGAVAD